MWGREAQGEHGGEDTRVRSGLCWPHPGHMELEYKCPREGACFARGGAVREGLSCREPCRSAPCPLWTSPLGPTMTAALRRVSELRCPALSPGRPVDWAAPGPSREVQKREQKGAGKQAAPHLLPWVGVSGGPCLISAHDPQLQTQRSWVSEEGSAAPGLWKLGEVWDLGLDNSSLGRRLHVLAELRGRLRHPPRCLLAGQ